MNRLAAHIEAHPMRLLVTMLCLIIISWGLAGIAIIRNFDAVHEQNVANCLALNEFRREVYVAAADLDVPPAVRARFLPTEDCENLP